jgi:hypothetical protein
LARLKAYKVELLAMLRSAADLGTCEDCGQALAETPAIPGEAKNPHKWGCFKGGFRKVSRPTDVRCWQLIGYSMAN